MIGTGGMMYTKVFGSCTSKTGFLKSRRSEFDSFTTGCVR